MTTDFRPLRFVDLCVYPDFDDQSQSWYYLMPCVNCSIVVKACIRSFNVHTLRGQGGIELMETGGSGQGQYDEYLQRYRRREWRARIFHDLIARDIRAAGNGCVVLDIGCGGGFDDDLPLQKSLAALSGRYIGIEPDAHVEPGAHVAEIHRCLFEQAPIQPGSIDVAFAVMVLEHVQNPQHFWGKVHEILKPGGTFWGMTVDGRSLFAKASFWLEQLHVKELYMRWLRGRRGEERYLNYPVFYRCNTPRQIEAETQGFAEHHVINFSGVGQHRHAFPQWLYPLSDQFDRWIVNNNKPGTLLMLRLVK
ncbi:MAG TPA: class I SAM-dependent methyltransferase [Roseiarcus sp.]|nr:class I SAM-dependent methyltransferase [Roseiarcus sp.]